MFKVQPLNARKPNTAMGASFGGKELPRRRIKSALKAHKAMVNKQQVKVLKSNASRCSGLVKIAGGVNLNETSSIRGDEMAMDSSYTPVNAGGTTSKLRLDTWQEGYSVQGRAGMTNSHILINENKSSKRMSPYGTKLAASQPLNNPFKIMKKQQNQLDQKVYSPEPNRGIVSRNGETDYRIS